MVSNAASAISSIAGRREGAVPRVFSFPVLLAALLVAGVFVCARLNPADPDMWWHIAAGEEILRTGVLPQFDPYSATAGGVRWIAYEWLGEVVLALASTAGLQGRAALLLALATTFFLLLYYYAWLRSGCMKSAFLACVVCLPLAAVFFTLRPQLIGYLFLLATLVLLERFRQGRQHTLWLLPLVFLLWVNTHGSFAFGLMAVGLYWASGWIGFDLGGIRGQKWTAQESRHLGLAFLLCVLVLPLTPYGTEVAAYPFEMAFLQGTNVASIIEWQPLTPDLALGKVFVALLLAFLVGVLAIRPRFRLEEIALLCFAVYSASVHRRFLIVLLAVLVPLVAVLLARLVPAYDPAKDRPALNAAGCLLILAGVGLGFPSEQTLTGVVERYYPVQAVAYLQENPAPEPMFNEYGWGGYLIWSKGREARVFIDGRADLYDYTGVLADYMSITLIKPDALRLLDKYGLRSALVRRKDPVATLLSASPQWRLIYADDLAAVFVRNSPAAKVTP